MERLHQPHLRLRRLLHSRRQLRHRRHRYHEEHWMSWLSTVPVEHATESQITSHRTLEREKLLDKMDKFLQICRKRRVKARHIYVETETIEEGIVKLLNVNEVGRLVMGAASDRRYKKGMMEITSEKAKYVNKHAPSYCHIWFVCIKLLIHTRYSSHTHQVFFHVLLRALLEDHQDLVLSASSANSGTSTRVPLGANSGTSTRVPSGENSGTSSAWISYSYVLMERIEILENEKAKIYVERT